MLFIYLPFFPGLSSKPGLVQPESKHLECLRSLQLEGALVDDVDDGSEYSISLVAYSLEERAHPVGGDLAVSVKKYEDFTAGCASARQASTHQTFAGD